MPYLHCKKCHHEWEGTNGSSCSWCGGDSYILELETPLEKTIKQLFNEPTEWDQYEAECIKETNKMTLTDEQREKIANDLAEDIVDSMDLNAVLQLCKEMVEDNLNHYDNEALLQEWADYYGKDYPNK
jgi:hypothetical protein